MSLAQSSPESARHRRSLQHGLIADLLYNGRYENHQEPLHLLPRGVIAIWELLLSLRASSNSVERLQRGLCLLRALPFYAAVQ